MGSMEEQIEYGMGLWGWRASNVVKVDDQGDDFQVRSGIK